MAYYPLDVSRPDAVTSCQRLLERDGVTIDVLVNNAAIYPACDAAAIDLTTLDQAWAVNARGPWLLCQAFVPGMRRRGYGRIVNVSSGGGSFAEGLAAGHAAYAVTKAALNALTVCLAYTLSGDVKVNAMCPGWVRTRMGSAPAPRSPETAAKTAVWLATLPRDGPSGGFFSRLQAHSLVMPRPGRPRAIRMEGNWRKVKRSSAVAGPACLGGRVHSR